MKTKTEHTPGPWIATVPPSICDVHRFIEAVREDEPNITLAEVGGMYSGGSIPKMARITIAQHTANARLIAAAPDLLAALEAIDECDWPQIGELHLRALAKTRAAIAKAKGE